MAAEKMDIDDSLYSRQRYVLGDSAMHRMANSAVLVYGLGGLGVEIAKNIVLAGVKSIAVQDPKVATIQDLGTQFFLKETDVAASKNRAEASSPHLAELNPYVSVMTMTQALTLESDLSYLSKYQCVILTECSLNVQKRVNNYCRSASPQIKFISTDVYGICGSAFVDFGDKFEVVDANGEEPKDVLVGNITKEKSGVVSTLEQNLHGLESGDVVTFREVKGMTALNGRQCEVKVMTPYTFSIGDTSSVEFEAYEGGGIFVGVKIPKEMNFEPLEKQIISPALLTPDLSKFDAPPMLHLAYLTLSEFVDQNKCLPKPGDQDDSLKFINIAKVINESLACKVSPVDEALLSVISRTASGSLAPLCAVFGGVIAQEALKALTGKFTPLNQWLHLDCRELVPNDSSQCAPLGDRYDSLRVCVGTSCCQLLANARLFMVGCGAIGCEMLKNYALLGISSGGGGKITITDNDLIEKSNLNRQFLFRPRHIQKPKSTTAAGATVEMNGSMKIEAHQHKVCPQTEATVYNDAFFEAQNIVVNALDNVEARRYVDGRCVTNQRPLMESGTMGTKGHVQVIVPHLTESYTSQQDPADGDFPYCTVKSFPAQLEHCIQWARDKFEEYFVGNAQLFNKFLEVHPQLGDVAEQLVSGVSIDGAVKVSKFMSQRPMNWADCVCNARCRFEKYFNHKAKQLLYSFPLDTKLEDGALFWASPKRPPTPINFDERDETHMLFVVTTARLLADVYKITWTKEDTEWACVQSILTQVKVPEFCPSNKKIVTDSSLSKDEATPQEMSGDVVVTAGRKIKQVLGNGRQGATHPVEPLDFEKDDDSNGHIDFITATSNLRAMMYSIDTGDRLKIKKIAGRIVPAIATTTAAVSGLVALEIIKVLTRAPLDNYKNCFLNLALPLMLLSEPGPVARTQLREGLSVTMWDKWEVRGHKDFTLKMFMDECKRQFGFEATAVCQGVKIVYMPFMPGHNKRLPNPMSKLLKPVEGQQYVDLVVSFEGDGDEDVPGPPVRYYF